jgi:putative transposase
MLQPCVEHDVPLSHVARHHGIPLRTAQRWLARYRRDGFVGLARRERRDRGHPHGLPPELTQMFEGLALRHPPPTVALVHRQVRDVALRHGWPVPNYKRVYRVVKRLDPTLVTLAHDGSKTYRTTYDLLYRREAEHPNDIWQADHPLLSVALDCGKKSPGTPRWDSFSGLAVPRSHPGGLRGRVRHHSL